MAVLKTLKIATRQSPLALWQANFVKDQLEKFHPTLSVELVPMVTKGDVILDSPLAKIGGKGLFVKELENALLEKRADIAVHSMKDVPMEFPEGLGLSVICKREDPRDAFVSNTYRSLDELPQLFNVLKGDLSMVGPRPILPQESKFNRNKTALLHSVKSGVTGLWQVSGRSNLSFEERIELELFYAQNWSFWLDIKILFKTVAVVLRKTGAK